MSENEKNTVEVEVVDSEKKKTNVVLVAKKQERFEVYLSQRLVL